ncbi:MAG: acetylornithine transaminase [Gemmatimonadetes bacterium]|nr:acetylornithine transaminase [Gemmatimonadota bacterium]
MKPTTESSAQGTASAAPAPLESAILGTYKRAPVELVRGSGVYLYDAEGKAYLDFGSGIAVNSLGYDDAGLKAALHAAAEGLIHTSNLYHTAPGERLAAALVARSFADKVFFCNSGAEANEGAFKIARRWARTQGDAKHEIIALRGAFHGRLFGTLAATDRPNYRLPFRPLAPGISIFERDLKELDAALDPDTVAAVIVEPIQGEGGVRVIDHGFLRELRAVTASRNIALIFDEIQCGLGRTGSLFAYEQIGVVPDILTLAKPLAGGLPMGAVLMTAPIASAMQYGDHGTTFGGGPFVASVALHVLDRLSDPALLAHVRETGAWFGHELGEIAHRTSRIRQVRGTGFIWGLDVMGTAAHVVSEAQANGLLVLTAGEYTVRLLPPLVATKEELARGLQILEEVL